jgi:hypothetical protein
LLVEHDFQASESPAGAEDVVDAGFEEVDEQKKDD